MNRCFCNWRSRSQPSSSSATHQQGCSPALHHDEQHVCCACIRGHREAVWWKTGPRFRPLLPSSSKDQIGDRTAHAPSWCTPGCWYDDLRAWWPRQSPRSPAFTLYSVGSCSWESWFHCELKELSHYRVAKTPPWVFWLQPHCQFLSSVHSKLWRCYLRLKSELFHTLHWKRDASDVIVSSMPEPWTLNFCDLMVF